MKIRYIITWRAQGFQTNAHGWVAEEDFEKLYVQPLVIGTARTMQRGIYRVPCRVMLCQKVDVEEPLLRPAAPPQIPEFPARPWRPNMPRGGA